MCQSGEKLKKPNSFVILRELKGIGDNDQKNMSFKNMAFFNFFVYLLKKLSFEVNILHTYVFCVNEHNENLISVIWAQIVVYQ